MKLEKLKEILAKDFAVSAMRALCFMIKVANKFSKDGIGIESLRFYKIKTKNYQVVILADTWPRDQFLLVRPKGFLKEWFPIEKDKIPEFLAEAVFSESCTKEDRKRLVSKIVELKAFW